MSRSMLVCFFWGGGGVLICMYTASTGGFQFGNWLVEGFGG